MFPHFRYRLKAHQTGTSRHATGASSRLLESPPLPTLHSGRNSSRMGAGTLRESRNTTERNYPTDAATSIHIASSGCSAETA